MSFLERAKQAAGQAAQVAKETAGQASNVVRDGAEKANAAAWDPATAKKSQGVLHLARRHVSTAVERIDPTILADVIIKATTLQERANAALKVKGSTYRIGTVSIGASIPPSVSFAIVRLGDPRAPAEEAGEPFSEVDEGEHLAAHSEEPIVALDGTTIGEADLADALDQPGDGGAGALGHHGHE